MKFANFRGRGLRNRCEPCTCRTRSHFFHLDDGSVYNIDTAGTIWYQAANSYKWKKIYKCRNYIPWSGGVGRLDHVMRDERGFPGNARYSMRVPNGRPMSGSFIGFQTDFNSCVVFLHGKIVYRSEKAAIAKLRHLISCLFVTHVLESPRVVCSLGLLFRFA